MAVDSISHIEQRRKEAHAAYVSANASMGRDAARAQGMRDMKALHNQMEDNG